MERALSRGDSIFGLFDKDNKLAAYYWLEFKEKLLYLGTIAIQKDYYGKSIGEKIMAMIDKTAVENKFNKIALTVDPLNGRAVRFYLKHNYLITGFKRAYFGNESPNAHRLWMEKSMDQIYDFENTEKKIYCADNEATEKAVNDGFIAVKLERDIGGDNHKNIIVFRRKISSK